MGGMGLKDAMAYPFSKRSSSLRKAPAFNSPGRFLLCSGQLVLLSLKL